MYTFTNPGDVLTAPLGLIKGGGVDIVDFSTVADGCSGQPLAAGASCTLTLAFAPTRAGSYSAWIKMIANPHLIEVALRGTGS